MKQFKEYIKDVMCWNDELKSFLESEAVSRDEEIWSKLNGLTKIMEGVNEDLDNEDLIRLQSEVNQLHDDMEAYFTKRQQLGSIFINDPYTPAGKHTLPKLPYAYNALEPHISEEIMRLHHTKHHQSYVDGLNKAELELEKSREKGNFDLVKHWSRELAFHGSGHYLHTIFWNNMTPRGGERPSAPLLREIEKYFGSFEGFKKHFTESANKVEGVGWALLVWAPRSRHLEILQSERHMNLTQWDTIPLLVLDVWEHAYYLQYKNNRGDYVKNWWNLVNWGNVEERFEQARQLKWHPY